MSLYSNMYRKIMDRGNGLRYLKISMVELKMPSKIDILSLLIN